jgi:thioredoxin-dependent peroxiredoxin
LPDKTRNNSMIDPPKATKGRRMSKKSRKKSSSPSPPRQAGAKAKVKSKTKARTTKAKTKAKTKTKTKSAARAKTKDAKIPSIATHKSSKKAAAATSHKAASKSLKSSDAKASPAGYQAGSPAGPVLVEGADAPAFHLPRDGGDAVRLADFSGQKLVLFFYPRADTPGCTREAIDFTRLADAFAECGTAVLGISADPVKAQEKFRDKHGLSIPLISDEKHEMLHAYGAWGEKSMYGKTFLGIIRTTVLIGGDGQIARVWRHVKVDGHAEAVLAAARAL